MSNSNPRKKRRKSKTKDAKRPLRHALSTCIDGDSRHLFPKRFKTWRADKKMPLKMVAAKIGVGTATVHTWEVGVRFPLMDNLTCISRLTRIPVCRWICIAGNERCVRFWNRRTGT